MDSVVIWGVMLAGCAMVLPVWLFICRGMAWKPARAQTALAAAGNVNVLIAQLQQHRGMSGAWLAGDASFASRLPAHQRRIDGLFELLEKIAVAESVEAYPCFRIAEARALAERWRALVAGLAESTPEQSFNEHCQIVAALLGWLRTLCEARVARPAAGGAKELTVSNFANRLPALAECLGQSRALACAVAARGYCAPVPRVRLVFLTARAEALLAKSVTKAGMHEADAACRIVGDFIATLRTRVLSVEGVDIKPADCFALATRAVDVVFAWQAREGECLRQAIGDPQSKSLRGAVVSKHEAFVSRAE